MTVINIFHGVLVPWPVVGPILSIRSAKDNCNGLAGYNMACKETYQLSELLSLRTFSVDVLFLNV